MAANSKMSRENRMMEKANALFLIYYQLGTERSLAKLLELCRTIKVKVSEGSLNNYSSKYEWQRKLLELETKAQEKREADAMEVVETMNRRHALLGQAFASIASSELQKLAENRKNKKNPITVYEIATLYKAGQHGERLARGQATNRTEVMIELITTFVREFALIFMGVNEIADPIERKNEYIRRCDEMLHEVYPKGDTKLIGG